MVIIDEPVERCRYVQRGQVYSQAARVDLEPPQTVPGIVAGEQRQTLGTACELFVQLIEFERTVRDLGHGSIEFAQR